MFESVLVIFRQPIRYELLYSSGLNDCPGKDMGANLPSLFEKNYAKLFIASFVRQLL